MTGLWKHFVTWVSGEYSVSQVSELSGNAQTVRDRISEALQMARRESSHDGRDPTLLDYFACAEKLGLTGQQMADLSSQDMSGFIIARAHMEDSRHAYLRSHGITVRGAKLDRCRIVPMTVIELMAMDTTTTMREAEFVAA
jgi:hypothetical protein